MEAPRDCSSLDGDSGRLVALGTMAAGAANTGATAAANAALAVAANEAATAAATDCHLNTTVVA